MITVRELKKKDPVTKQQEKGLDQQEDSPMDPPAAYEEPGKVEMKKEDMCDSLQAFMHDHEGVLKVVAAFEKGIVEYKSNGYKLNKEINESFGNFFKCLDDDLLPHNRKEEKILFPVLNQKLIVAGEHSKGPKMVTAIDVMEDDHVKFIQLGALAFNLLGLSSRIADERSKIFVLDTAYETSRELIELLKLHIYREDITLFPLAQKFISKEEFAAIQKQMDQF
ncbi:MAG: hemerythrin domain-containing protein [Bacteroidetes bacterium]|nr:hemerythrin domain-containing protein [Bacteroidota bacterium]